MKGRFLELVCGTAFAFAQPLFDLLGRNPEFLVAHRLYGAGLVAFAIGLATLPPVALWAVEAAVQRARPALAGRIHSAILALLFALTALAPLQRNVEFGVGVPVGLALVVGAGVAWAIARQNEIRTVARAGAFAILFFTGIFLARPAVWELATSRPPAVTTVAASSTPVLMVVVDALPLASVIDADGALDPARFPHLAGLATDGIWFRNATTCADFTARAVPAILTGRMPLASERAHWSSWPENLFTLLAPTHEVLAAEWVSSLCPPRLNALGDTGPGLATLLRDTGLVYLHVVFPEALVRGLPSVSGGWRNFSRARGGIAGDGALGGKVAQVDAFVRRIREPGPTPFAFLHVELPHRPYALYPSGRLYSATGSEFGGRTKEGRRVDDERVVRHAQQRHLLQSAYVDARLGDILDAWRARGVYDDSAIVVVADHGVSFEPGEFARHLDGTNPPAVLPVPLVLKLPGNRRAGEVSSRNAETIDLLPTLAGILGRAVNFDVDGVDLLDPRARMRPVKRAVADATGEVREFEPDLFEAVRARAGRRVAREAIPDLVSRPVAGFEIRPGDPGALGIQSPREVSIEPDARLLPGEAFGFVRVPRHGREEIEIAVAVDDTIRAVTSPYRRWDRSDLAVWYALIPEESLPAGRRRIDAYRVEREDGSPVLRAADGTGVTPSYLSLPLGDQARLGVKTEGIRESKARARDIVRFEVPMRSDERPRSLRLVLEALDPGGTDVTLTVNGARVLERNVPAGETRVGALLPELARGETVRLELKGVPATLDPETEWTFGRIEIRLDP